MATIPNTGALGEVSRYTAEKTGELLEEGRQYIDSLRALREVDYFGTGDVPTLGFGLVNYDAEISQINAQRPTRPTLNTADLDALVSQLAAVPVPTAPTITPTAVAVPNFDVTAPTIATPLAPSTDVGAAPTDVPEITDVALPDSPTFALPAVPTFEELALPPPPSAVLPSFNAVVPVNNLTAPTNDYSYVEQEYESALRDPLVAQLLSDLANGGYGINPDDEEALWERARARVHRESLSMEQEIRRDAASSGFPLPQGVMFMQLRRAQQGSQDKVAEVSRDIAVERSKLYVDNRRFTMQQIIQYEQLERNLHNAVAERAMNHAKFSAEIGIQIFDAAVRNYNAQLQGFQAEAQVFSERIRAELAKVQIYGEQLKASGLQLEAQRTKVQIYAQQLQGVQTVAQIYRTRLEAANTQAEIQARKLDVFRVRIQAFAERVRAKEIEFRLYDAQLRGETQKIDVYRAQLDGFRTQISSSELLARVGLQNTEQSERIYQIQVNAYNAQLTSMAQRLRARVEQLNTGTQVYSADINAYRALVDGISTGANVRLQNQKLNNDWNTVALNSQVRRAEFNLGRLQATVENSKAINQWGANFYRTALGAAASSLQGLSVRNVSATEAAATT